MMDRDEMRLISELMVRYGSFVGMVLGFAIIIMNYEELRALDFGMLIMGFSFGSLVTRAIRELKEDVKK
jgi:hypothetical protein